MTSDPDSLPTWVSIQMSTFTNWLNYELRGMNVRISDLREDLKTGVTLIRIMEQLQKRVCTGRVYVNKPTEIQCLMNVNLALEALQGDGIKLVNIGSQDIVCGNLKLILGLVWLLIQRYQIAQQSKVPAKKLLMAWLQSVLPEIRLTNFRQNWNDGLVLSALVNYCQPGSFPDWHNIDTSQKYDNCKRALEVASEELDVPAILTPENMCSSDLDELSCITYLSYFVRKGGPGYNALLANVRSLIPDVPIDNFESAWQDGCLLCRLINEVGGNVSAFGEMIFSDKSHWLWNIRQALDAAIDLGIDVSMLITAEEVLELGTDAHLGLMALCAALCSLRPDYDEDSEEERKEAEVFTSCAQNQQLNLDLAFSDQANVPIDQLDVVVTGPEKGRVPNNKLSLEKHRTERGVVLSLMPQQVGNYTVRILCDEVDLVSPIQLKVLTAAPHPPTVVNKSSCSVDVGASSTKMNLPHYYDPPSIGHVSFSGLSEPCLIGSVVEVVINAQGGKVPGNVKVLSISPSKRQQPCEVIHQGNFFTAIFTPNEVGDWQVVILYDNQHIRGSPFSCQVFDSDQVSVYGLDVGLVGQELNFNIDASKAGQGHVKVTVFRNNFQIPCGIVEERVKNRYRVRFMPDGPGQYQIQVMYNNTEIKGSPFILDIADASAVSVHGDQLKIAAVNRPAVFFVHVQNAELKDLNVIVTDPFDHSKPARVVAVKDESFRVEWLPLMLGEHQIDVQLYGQSVYDSAFVCNVGDPQLVTVKNIPEFIDPEKLNQDLSFEIDASNSGSGNLEIIVNSGRVTCRVRELATRHFLAQFTPTQAVPHLIKMKFNNEPVRGSPWMVPVRSNDDKYQNGNGEYHKKHQQQLTSAFFPNDEDQYSELTGIGLHRAQVGKVSFFDISVSVGQLKPPDVTVRMIGPDGRPVETNLFALRDVLRCEYTIHQVGDYKLEIYINGRLIDSGPLTVAGYDPNKIRVHPIKVSDVGSPAQFVVEATEQVGKGQLEISVNQGKVPNNVQMQDAGRCLVTFIPQHTGTYLIDVTFNGQQVHGCPIRVDVNAKNIGKPVSAPVVHQQRFSGGTAAVAGSVSPRPPSSAYYSAGSPYVDTSMPSPALGTTFQTRESPRSPGLIAAHTRDRSSDQDEKQHTGLRSPRLVHEARGGGYTVAHYDDRRSPPPHHTVNTHRYFGDVEDIRARPGDSTVDSGLGSYSATSPRPHRYFEAEPPSSREQHDWRKPIHHQEHGISSPPPLPKSPPPADDPSTAQFEMTRSAEVKLYHDTDGTLRPATIKTQDLTTYGGSVDAGSTRVEEQGYDYRVTSNSTPSHHRQIEASRRLVEQQISPAPLGDLPSRDYEQPPTVDELNKSKEFRSVPIENALIQKPAFEEQKSGHKKRPSGSLTPNTRRKIFEHSVQKVSDLKESSFEYQSESDVGSKNSSKPTTPRLSFKFNKDKMRDPSKGFEFGKSKFTSKHEVVRLGKDVDVKLESLKLTKEDQLRVVVVPPTRLRASEDAVLPDLPHRLKKSGKTYEITFRPIEVGTHKVMAFVNDQPHPQTPFPIRVYDASQIIVGDIVSESIVNDAVEFTVDAGRAGFGNLELAIKNADGIIIPSHVSQLETGTAKFLVTFNPSSLGTHSVNITFNKEIIKGSPFEVQVLDSPSNLLNNETMTSEIKKGKLKDKKKESKKAERNGSFKVQPIVSKLPSLSRVGKPAVILLQVPDDNDSIVVTVTDSAKQNQPAEIFGDSEGMRRIEFLPQRVGDHEIHVNVNGADVNGSPFTCRVYDPTRIIVGQISDGVVNKPVHFTVDANEAGVGNLEVAVNEGKIPSMAQALGQHKYEISFVPRENIDHQISVRFNNEQVPGSPFLCRLLSALQVSASGSGLERVAVGRAVSFVIDMNRPEGQPRETPTPQVIITDSKGHRLPVSVSKDVRSNNPGRFVVEYMPKSVGNHHVEVVVDGDQIHGSPFSVKAFDASCARLSLAERAVVHKPCTFVIDASKSGAGNMEIIVSVDDRNVPNFVQAEGQAKFKVSFTPQEAKDHVISVKFNNEPIPGSPMICPVESDDGYSRAPPLPKSPPPVDEELRLIGDLAVAQVGQPKRFSIDAPNANIDCNVVVTVDWSKSGGSTIDVKVSSVNGKQVPCKMKQLKRCLHECTFTPTEPGLYLIDVYINNVRLPECPYECDIKDSTALRVRGDAVNVAQVGRTANFEVITGNTNYGDLDVMITDPHNSPLPVRCYKQHEKSHWVEFTPEHAGTHVIDVTFADLPVNGSPFRCEVVDPKKVKVQGLSEQQVVRHVAHVTVLRKNAGNGQLELEVRDPQGAQLKVDRLKNSLDEEQFNYLPTKVGSHAISLKLAGFAVPSVPKTIKVEEREQLALQGPGIEKPAVEVNQPVVFHLDTKHQNGGLKIDVRDPEDNKVRHSTIKRADNTTEITFHPTHVGHYTVAVEFNNKKLSGSPYKVSVVDARKVLVNDENSQPDGSLLLALQEQNLLEVDAVAAGQGLLRVEVRDSRGELLGDNEAYVEEVGQGNYRLIMTPRRAGTYKMFLYFSDIPVPSAYPLVVHVEPNRAHGQTPTPKGGRQEPRHIYTSSHSHTTSFESASTPVEYPRVRAYGEGLNRAVVREAAEFFVDVTSASRAKVTATMVGDQADIPIRLQQVETNLYKAVYTPTVSGTYKLQVFADNRPLRSSPYQVHVSSFKSAADLIEVDARTLKIGILGEDVKTVIDARKATAGHLSAQCQGPNQLEYCELYDNQDGTYILRITPKELGRHVLSIKYSDEHVRGSPFVFNVSNPPDASKVKVYGSGIEHGILAKYKSNFVVETKGAGAGQLTVRVRGPKGAFNVEMQRDRQQERTIHCKYEPREPGDYQVEVKWHGVHVPGSPFMVLIVDTEQELQRFLAGNAPSPPPHTPFVPPGWIGTAPAPPHGIAPPMTGPPLAPSLYGPIPISMMPAANIKGRKSSQPIYGRASRPRY